MLTIPNATIFIMSTANSTHLSSSISSSLLQHAQQRSFGVINDPSNTVALLLGSGELGKEIAIELMRLGACVIAADSYPHAPAMQIAHEAHVLDMTDGAQLTALINQTQPDIIIPEIEAIDTSILYRAAQEQRQVVPSARIASITMDRGALRKLAHETLGLPTTRYQFAYTYTDFLNAANTIGYPCVVKPLMSSSGHGQSIIQSFEELPDAWKHAQSDRRGAQGHEDEESGVIVEALVCLDYELTVLTVSSSAGIVTCEPIAHTQSHGDYRQSWQPAHIPNRVRQEAQNIAQQAVTKLTQIAQADGEYGWGVYGVELFVLTDGSILFNELSPRPHDTGMVTMISQRYSEFALHARCILGVPISSDYTTLALHEGEVAASQAIVVEGEGTVSLSNLPQALSNSQCSLRIFAKPHVHARRRMAVSLAIANGVDQAQQQAAAIAHRLHIRVSNI